MESLYEAWERYKDLLRKCPHHGLPVWLQVQTFYNGLGSNTRIMIDAAPGLGRTRIIRAGLNPYRRGNKSGFGMGFNNPDESGSGFGITRTNPSCAAAAAAAFRLPLSRKQVKQLLAGFATVARLGSPSSQGWAFDEAIAELDTLGEESYKDSTLITTGVKFVMENEQRVDLDVSETDESVGVRVGMDMAAENNDTAAELEPDSTTVEQGGGSGSGRGRGCRGRVMQGHYSQGTNHLINHAKRCPRRSIKNVQQMHLSFSSKVDGTTALSNYSTEPKWDMATMRVFIARMIVMHELPLSFVEYIGFYELLKLLQPSIETISRNTIKAEILKLYDIEKTKAMSVLEACDSKIAVTTDMWTAGNQKKRFIYVPAPHSGEVMCNELYECLMEWNIDKKLSTVTVDNCSANESVIDLLLGKFSASLMIMGEKFLHMRCCAHILNLIVKDDLSVIQKGVEKIRESVHYWTATPSRFEKFEAAKK
ncbi:hypothetical protein WN943_010274 [Citrus x changshan-huyou]